MEIKISNFKLELASLYNLPKKFFIYGQSEENFASLKL